MSMSELTFTRTFDDGVTYEWSGGFGAVLKSRERGVKVGTVRYICRQTLYAYNVMTRPRWGKREVWWSMPDTDSRVTMEDIRAFEKKFRENS